MREIQSRLHASFGARTIVRYTCKTYSGSPGVIASNIGSRCSPDVHVIGLAILVRVALLDGDKRPHAAQIRLDAFTYVSRDPRAESRLESKSTFECARKHSKINDLRDTRERVLCSLACLPASPLAHRRRLRHGMPRGNVNCSNSFATFLLVHCPYFSVMR